MQQAKVLFKQDGKYKSGWKFDHVWDIIKSFEKFKDCATKSNQPSKRSSLGNASSESENHTPEYATQTSPGLSSFDLNFR